MAAAPSRDVDYRRYVDAEEGRIDRRIFWDEAIYEAELEQIFARAWLFVAHESEIPDPGDFVTNYMGEDGVIVARRKDGGVGVYLNSCPHRGNRVCFAETGRVRQFVCNYHGWSFGLDGSLLGMHEEQAYLDSCPNFDKSKLGLHAARAETYKGLIFATFADDAPSLVDYLGDYAWYLDILLDNDEGGTEIIGPPLSSIVNCNWKFPAENFVGDSLHAGWTHDSAAQAIFGHGVRTDHLDETYHANVNGHGIEFGLDVVGNAATLGERSVVRYLRARQEEVAKRLGEMRSKMIGALSSANVFPNLAFLLGHSTIRTWIPRGPHQIELRSWTLVNRNAPDEIKEAYRRGVLRTFSPGGILEMDDGENWENATRSNRGVVTRRQPLHYALGLDSGIEHDELPGNVAAGFHNDTNQRALYTRWADFMNAGSWADIPPRPAKQRYRSAS